MRAWHLCILLLASLAFTAQASLAASVTPACPLPSDNTDPKLSAAFETLGKLRSTLDPDVAWYNSICTKGVSKKSSEYPRCADTRAEWDKYDRNRMLYEQDRARAIRAAELTSIGQRLNTTRASLRNNAVRAGQLDKDIEHWLALEDEARRQADDAVLELAKGYLFDRLDDRIAARKPIAVAEAKVFSARWPSFADERLIRMQVEALAALRNAESAEDLSRVLKAFEQAVSANLAVVSKNELKQWAEFAMGAMELALNDPYAKLIVQDAKIGAAALYGWAVAYYAREAYQEISAIGESQYRSAKLLAEMYEKDLRAKAQLEKKPLNVGTAPNCS